MNPTILAQQFGTPDGNKTFPVPTVPANCNLAIRVAGTYVDFEYIDDRTSVTITGDAPQDRAIVDLIAVPQTFAK